MRQSRGTAPTATWIALGTFLLAFIVWQACNVAIPERVDVFAAAQVPTADGELSMVSSPVASPAAPFVPSPLPPPTTLPLPLPLAPAVVGQPVSYGDAWIVTATDVSLVRQTLIWTPRGIFAVVAITIENQGRAQSGFPFDDLRLEVDGSFYAPDFGATNTIGAGYFQSFPPAEPLDTAVVFDIPVGAPGPFILQSATDPNFRVLVQLARRG